MSKEIWKNIEKYEGYYQVSNLGRVKSLVRKGRLAGRILRPILDFKGYCQVNLCMHSSIKKSLIHRLVAQAFILNSDNKLQVNHKNGVKADNRVDNLEWCTNSENNKHAFDKLGRKASYGNARLTKADVVQIRESTLKYRELEKIFKVVGSTISKIKNDKIWR